ncbi:VOC family protein [Jiella sp. M17.18]|uniref:VOC family protein n=1 Tax=Jiella sp. M17.18 TaxID=3234247 RepID=UPI0034DF2BB3
MTLPRATASPVTRTGADHDRNTLHLLYVADPEASARFYGPLFRREPMELSPTFALFALDGVMFGLWKRAGVEPAADAGIGGSEFALRLGDRPAVDAFAERLPQLGATVLQAPTQMDFGYTATARSPDGHRIRVFARTEA